MHKISGATLSKKITRDETKRNGANVWFKWHRWATHVTPHLTHRARVGHLLLGKTSSVGCILSHV